MHFDWAYPVGYRSIESCELQPSPQSSEPLVLARYPFLSPVGSHKPHELVHHHGKSASRKEVPHSILRASLLPSSMTFSILNGRQSYILSLIKSKAQTLFKSSLNTKACFSLVMNRFLVFLLRLSFIAQ